MILVVIQWRQGAGVPAQALLPQALAVKEENFE
jgi:hypothetical protein